MEGLEAGWPADDRSSPQADGSALPGLHVASAGVDCVGRLTSVEMVDRGLRSATVLGRALPLEQGANR